MNFLNHLLKIKFILLIICYLVSNSGVLAQIEKETPYYTDSSVYNVTYYGITLKLNPESTYIEGFTTIKATAGQNLTTFCIELNSALMVDSVCLSNKTLPFSHTDHWLKVSLNAAIVKNHTFEPTVYYHGDPIQTGANRGIISKLREGKPILYTLTEPFSAFDFFPCKQMLTDKADSVRLALTVPQGYCAVGNGALISKTSAPNNNVQYVYDSHYPLSYYLIAFAVADYNEYSYHFNDTVVHDSLYFRNFYYNEPSYLEKNRADIDKTTDIIQAFERVLHVPYPFRNEGYGQVTAPVGGGMENQTITMLQDFKFDLVSHELAHSWFGDMVTCADWQSIWLNEGFASYMEYVALEQLKPAEKTAWLNDALTYATSEPDGAVYVPSDDKYDENRIFSYALTYKKGALFIHMLRSKINNDSLFFNILGTYLKRFAFSNASANDFLLVAEEISGLELHHFFDQYYFGEGFPMVALDWKLTGNKLVINVQQSHSNNKSILFDMQLKVRLIFTDHSDSTLLLSFNTPTFTKTTWLKKYIDTLTVNDDVSQIATIHVTATADTSKQAFEMHVYPNPFNDSLTVEIPGRSTNHAATLYDTNGKELGKWLFSGNEKTLATARFSSGMYIMVTDNGKKKTDHKIFKY